MVHTETLVTTEESAFLRIDNSLVNLMGDTDSPQHKGYSPHLMED